MSILNTIIKMFASKPVERLNKPKRFRVGTVRFPKHGEVPIMREAKYVNHGKVYHNKGVNEAKRRVNQQTMLDFKHGR